MNLNRINNPEDYFSQWHFEIRPWHYSIFGVVLRPIVDREKTKKHREETQDKKGKVMKLEWKIPKKLQSDFHEGDIFSSKKSSSIQIVSINDMIEVHEVIAPKFEGKTRRAYQVMHTELIDWLRSGAISKSRRISPVHSSSETLRYYIEDENSIHQQQSLFDS